MSVKIKINGVTYEGVDELDAYGCVWVPRREYIDKVDPPTETLTISENGNYDVSKYAYANVAVQDDPEIWSNLEVELSQNRFIVGTTADEIAQYIESASAFRTVARKTELIKFSQAGEYSIQFINVRIAHENIEDLEQKIVKGSNMLYFEYEGIRKSIAVTGYDNYVMIKNVNDNVKLRVVASGQVTEIKGGETKEVGFTTSENYLNFYLSRADGYMFQYIPEDFNILQRLKDDTAITSFATGTYKVTLSPMIQADGSVAFGARVMSEATYTINATPPKIPARLSAEFTDLNTVYADTTLDYIASWLVVKPVYSDGTTGEAIDYGNYYSLKTESGGLVADNTTNEPTNNLITIKGEGFYDGFSTAMYIPVYARIYITGLKINKTMSVLNVGETEQLTATFEPDIHTEFLATMTWSSSNEDVATVDSTGLVTAKAVGDVTITCESRGSTDDFSVSCYYEIGDLSVPITGITMSPTTFELFVAEQTFVNASIVPSNYTEVITSAAWSSDYKSVATVSSAGQVTALNAGTAHIKYTVTCASGTFSNFSTVTVSEVPVLPDSITVVLSVLGGTPSSSVETYEIQDGVVDYQFAVDDTFETGGTFFVYRKRSSYGDTAITLAEGTDYSITSVTGGYNVQILNCEKDDYVTISYSSPSQSTVTSSVGTGLVDLAGEAAYGSVNLIVTQTQSLTTEPNQIEITYTSSNAQASNIMLKYCLLAKTDSTWSVTKYRRFNSSADVVPTASDVTVTLDGTKVTKVKVASIDSSKIKFSSNSTDGTNGSATGTPTYTVTVSYV